jgi:hypothetical protein
VLHVDVGLPPGRAIAVKTVVSASRRGGSNRLDIWPKNAAFVLDNN